MTHTSAPWEYSQEDGTGYYISGPSGIQLVAHVRKGKGIDATETEANAYLIAAAPEMLEALKTILNATKRCPLENDIPTIIAVAAQAIIAKAETDLSETKF